MQGYSQVGAAAFGSSVMVELFIVQGAERERIKVSDNSSTNQETTATRDTDIVLV